MKVRLDEMNWPEVREKLNAPNVVLIPVGSTEQHGTHLPLNVDSACATYIAENAAKKVMKENQICILVAPTIDYTDVSIHKMFPGTIGVTVETLLHMITDIVNNFLEQGFKNIIVVNSHRQNNCTIESALRIISDRNPKANTFAVTTIGGLGFDARPGLVKAGIVGEGHSLEVETSTSLVIQPQNVHLDKVIIGSRKLPLSERYIGATGMDQTKGVIYHPGATGFEKSGTFGDPSMASKEEGEKLLSAIINDLADITVQVVKA